MRRTDREVTDAQKMKAILDRCKIVSYAMWDGKKPYAVIMNFGYEFTPEGKLRLYSHSALEGKKVSIIRGICNKAAAIMECGERVVIDPEIPCKSDSAFQSIKLFTRSKFSIATRPEWCLPSRKVRKTSSRCSALSAMSTPAKSA